MHNSHAWNRAVGLELGEYHRFWLAVILFQLSMNIADAASTTKSVKGKYGCEWGLVHGYLLLDVVEGPPALLVDHVYNSHLETILEGIDAIYANFP
jgi:hypothetical protein